MSQSVCTLLKNDKQDYQSYPVILSKYIIFLADINLATDEICQSLLIKLKKDRAMVNILNLLTTDEVRY